MNKISYFREREEHLKQQRTKPTSKFKVTVNATDLFERYLYEEEYDEYMDNSLPNIHVSEIAFGQTINFPINNAENVTLAGKYENLDDTE